MGMDTARLARVSPWLRAYVDEGKLAGANVAVIRDGHIVFRDRYGQRDIDSGAPMADDTIVRIYSMTKPMTTVAAMMLYEQGHFQLDDPVSRYIPAFADMQVWLSGEGGDMHTESAHRPFTVRELMTHTGGLTYGFIGQTPVDALYRECQVDFQTADKPLAQIVAGLAELPLLAQPGVEWNYSVSTDVLGHLVELWSGQDFEAYLTQQVIKPLGMLDTGFHVPEEKWDRFAANYTRGRNGHLDCVDPGGGDSRYSRQAVTFSGGGGLVSTVDDYLRFMQMLLNQGELHGTRLLGRKAVELMTSNHLPADMASMGQPRFSESSYEGKGFGLGGSVMLDPAVAQIVGSPGEFAWGGAASTAFWVDPLERCGVVFLTQLMPSSQYPIRNQLRVLTYQAIVD
jgi:CubicO group peptidase (beta-lactamase class C family)